MDDYAKAGHPFPKAREIMAKYRLIRKADGSYDLSASLTEGRKIFYLSTRKEVPSGVVGEVIGTLARGVAIARSKRKTTRIDGHIPGVTD